MYKKPCKFEMPIHRDLRAIGWHHILLFVRGFFHVYTKWVFGIHKCVASTTQCFEYLNLDMDLESARPRYLIDY